MNTWLPLLPTFSFVPSVSTVQAQPESRRQWSPDKTVCNDLTSEAQGRVRTVGNESEKGNKKYPA